MNSDPIKNLDTWDMMKNVSMSQQKKNTSNQSFIVHKENSSALFNQNISQQVVSYIWNDKK